MVNIQILEVVGVFVRFRAPSLMNYYIWQLPIFNLKFGTVLLSLNQIIYKYKIMKYFFAIFITLLIEGSALYSQVK
jgi:hypothetical protein